MRKVYWYVSVILPPLILAGAAVWLWMHWDAVPAQVPLRFDISGAASSFEGKHMLWVLLAVGLGLYLALFISSFFPNTWRMRGIRPEERAAVVPIMAGLLADLRITMAAMFAFFVFWSAMNAPGPAWVQNTVSGLLVFVPLLRYVVRLYILRR